jgi:GH15 family glucan-1,4-alpha-glucosidase
MALEGLARRAEPSQGDRGITPRQDEDPEDMMDDGHTLERETKSATAEQVRGAAWLRHGVYGNGRVLALVTPTSAIEWLCLPRFDSPSVFGRILDRHKGGTFRILHRGDEIGGSLSYVRNTNVLSTLFRAGDSEWEVIDFAPRIPAGLTVDAPIEIVRLVRPIKGQPQLQIDFDPRPDYGRARPGFLQDANTVDVKWDGGSMTLSTNVPVPYVLSKRPFVLVDAVYFVLTWQRRRDPVAIADVLRDLDLTIAGWQAWSRTCALPSFAAPEVLRSALCLKLHASHDTGAIIAATTTSIPESMGSARTWDYRYCWLRDAAFVVEALRRLSHVTEGEQFISFLRNVAESGPLQPVYSIDGGRDLPEEMLPHLEGFHGNGFVRIGNAAYTQRQNDLVGELMLCLGTVLSDPRMITHDSRDLFPLIARLVEEALAIAPEPDTSIWEFRTLLRHYTFSKAMCWVAVARGASLARRLGRADLADEWSRKAVALRQEILARGFNPTLGFFTQALDGQNPDAANLLLPTIGFLDARDERFASTVNAYERLLVDKGLMLRYRNPDDLGATTSAFTICSFWWSEALALMGRLEDSIAVFNHLLQFANPVGLFSEDVDPVDGLLLGNFPQAYTHVGVINAAMVIGDMLEVRDGRVHAWA